MEWKSYPGLSTVIKKAKDFMHNKNARDIGQMAHLMQGHETLQNAPIVVSIAALISDKIRSEHVQISGQRINRYSTFGGSCHQQHTILASKEQVLNYASTPEN